MARQRILKKKPMGPEGKIINLIERKYEWRPLEYPIVKRGQTALMIRGNESFSITMLKAAIEQGKANELLWKQRTDREVNEIEEWVKEQKKEIENGKYEFIENVNSLSVKYTPSETLQKIRHDIQKRIDRLEILRLDRITSLGDLTKKLKEKRGVIDKEIAGRTR